MKLHLGCGQRYLQGYVNIDLPPDEPALRPAPVADRYEDLTCLRFAAGSVEEVRLHHVFEHFPRPQALALLACWNAWLAPGGLVHIEVPDFARTAFAALRPLAGKAERRRAVRHLFGSHEASWAVHREGWSVASLSDSVAAFGFGDLQVRRNSWKGTHNFEVIARRRHSLDAEAAAVAARRLLCDYLVDRSESELRLLEVWLQAFEAQRARGWPE